MILRNDGNACGSRGLIMMLDRAAVKDRADQSEEGALVAQEIREQCRAE